MHFVTRKAYIYTLPTPYLHPLPLRTKHPRNPLRNSLIHDQRRMNHIYPRIVPQLQPTTTRIEKIRSVPPSHVIVRWTPAGGVFDAGGDRVGGGVCEDGGEEGVDVELDYVH